MTDHQLALFTNLCHAIALLGPTLLTIKPTYEWLKKVFNKKPKRRTK